jgi:hypothetical protein
MSTKREMQKPVQPKTGRDRSRGRFDLPVVTPSTTRAKLARKLV